MVYVPFWPVRDRAEKVAEFTREGRSANEIARLLGCSRYTVKRYRAKSAKMKKEG